MVKERDPGVEPVIIACKSLPLVRLTLVLLSLVLLPLMGLRLVLLGRELRSLILLSALSFRFQLSLHAQQGAQFLAADEFKPHDILFQTQPLLFEVLQKTRGGAGGRRLSGLCDLKAFRRWLERGASVGSRFLQEIGSMGVYRHAASHAQCECEKKSWNRFENRVDHATGIFYRI